MIENRNGTSKSMEKALKNYEQAKQRVANEKKKQNEKKRKAENHHKYIMGGIVVKYFPDCCRYDEGQVSLAMDNASKLAYAEGVVCLATTKRGKGQQADLRNSPSQAALAALKRSYASLCEHLRSDKSQSAAFICPQSL